MVALVVVRFVVVFTENVITKPNSRHRWVICTKLLPGRMARSNRVFELNKKL